MNLYGYVLNNPINFFDPFGLDSWWDATKDWYLERGATGNSNSNRRVYDASHQITKELMMDEGVQQAKDAWAAAGYPSSFGHDYAFGVKDYLRELVTLDGTGSFLGSYRVEIRPCDDGSIIIDVYNTTGWESGTRSPIPGARRNPSVEDMINGAPLTLNPKSLLSDKPRVAPGNGGNFYQHYWWIE